MPRGNISCGDDPLSAVGVGDEEVIYITIPLGTTRFIASTCNDITGFATRLELQSSNGTVLEVDEGSCSLSRASIINTTRPLLNRHYVLTIRGVDLTDSGLFLLTTECIIGVEPIPTASPTKGPTNPTNEPTPSPTRVQPSTASPSNAPTAGPTPFPTPSPSRSQCPDCPYNVTLSMIGNVTIELCPTSSPTIRWEYHSDSDSSAGSKKGTHFDDGYRYKKCIDDTSSDSEDDVEDSGFSSWYNAKCGISDDSDSMDSDDSDGSQSSDRKRRRIRRRSLVSYHKDSDSDDSDDSDSDSEEDGGDHQFVTEVCIQYDVDDLAPNLDCGSMVSVFLGLCENEHTDFNSSSIDADDLEGLITSFSPDDGTIESVKGVRNEDGTLGILVEFNRFLIEDVGIEGFELCLGNVTVDSDFNHNKETIDVGEGVVVVQDGDSTTECPSDGLPCLSLVDIISSEFLRSSLVSV